MSDKSHVGAVLESGLLAPVVFIACFLTLGDAVAAGIIAGIVGVLVYSVRRLRERSAHVE